MGKNTDGIRNGIYGREEMCLDAFDVRKCRWTGVIYDLV